MTNEEAEKRLAEIEATYYVDTTTPLRPGTVIWFFVFWIFVVCFLTRVI